MRNLMKRIAVTKNNWQINKTEKRKELKLVRLRKPEAVQKRWKRSSKQTSRLLTH